MPVAARGAAAVVLLLLAAGGARADEIAVGPGESIQDALDAAQPGDRITVAEGTYPESLVTARDGSERAPIVLRAEPSAEVIVTASGRVLQVAHAHFVAEGLVLDGQYGDTDAVQVEDGGDFLVLRGVEVRRTSGDCIDMAGPEGVLIEGSLIHHCLNATDGRTDAHGVTGGPVRGLTIRATEIHTFSGDAVQFDPGRSSPAWDLITIEGCRFWLAPLEQAENGFAAGVVPGENALDTKTPASGPRSRLVVRDTVAYGFGGGLISNMAAFNIKENVDAVIDRVTVRDSEIGFRLRGPALVAVQNAVAHDLATAVRYEDDIQGLRVRASTLGDGVGEAFVAAAADGATLEVTNLLVLGAALPPEASGAGNLAAEPGVFVDLGADDYHLVAGSAPVDQGELLDDVLVDRDGVARPQGDGHDVGAYEWCAGDCPTAPDAGLPGDGDAGPGDGDGDADRGGCGCRFGARPGGGGWLWLLLLFAATRVNRRG